MWKIFSKAKRTGALALIPIYNQYVLFEIAGLKGWYVFLSFIPLVGAIIMLVFTIKCYIALSKSFGKEPGFAAGLILLPVVFFPLLAFGNNEYIGPNGEASNAQVGTAVPGNMNTPATETPVQTNSVQQSTFENQPVNTSTQENQFPQDNNQL